MWDFWSFEFFATILSAALLRFTINFILPSSCLEHEFRFANIVEAITVLVHGNKVVAVAELTCSVNLINVLYTATINK